ncbi:MAG: signal peptidase I [Thiolinea sp.]
MDTLTTTQRDRSRKVNTRKPLLASVMSLILPGFGQLYNGQLNKGILLFITFILCSLAVPAVVALYLPAVLTLPLVVMSLIVSITIWVYSVVQAWRSAKHQKAYAVRNWQQPATYIGGFLIAMIILSVATQYVRGHLLESFVIPSSSMEPSILKGDVLFADKRYNCPGCKHHAQRGDTAIFVYPNNRSLYYIKRIIGLPGDQIRIVGQTVYVNGKPLAQQKKADGESYMVTEQLGETSYQVRWDKGGKAEMASLTVQPGTVFVLGDNRSATKDSRQFGAVPLMDVVGKVRQVWFSKGEAGIRWKRLGQTID